MALDQSPSLMSLYPSRPDGGDDVLVAVLGVARTKHLDHGFETGLDLGVPLATRPRAGQVAQTEEDDAAEGFLPTIAFSIALASIALAVPECGDHGAYDGQPGGRARRGKSRPQCRG